MSRTSQPFIEKAGNVAILVLGVCAAILTWIVVRREYGVAERPSTSVAAVHVRDWRRYVSSGQSMGPESAAVTVVEFADFQCPFCRLARDTLRALRLQFPKDVRILYRHYPLQGLHSHAFEAALAAECAAAQGRFEELHDVMYQVQESLGIVGWTDLARRARISDPVAFTRCVHSNTFVGRVVRDIIAGDSLGVVGTPTMLVNDVRFTGVPRLAFLDSLVRRVLSRDE
jgi:protein-disulfide isomerase